MAFAGTSNLAEATYHTSLSDAHDAMPPSEVLAMSESQSTIVRLPNELLLNVFRYLDELPPTAKEERLYDEPTFDLITSSTTNIKNVSLVSKRWRQAALPVLFRHAQLRTPEAEPQPDTAGIELNRFLTFMEKGQLRNIVSTFTLCCPTSSIGGLYSRQSLNSFQSFWTSLFSILDPREILIIAPPESLSFLTACPVLTEELWCFDAPCHYLRLQKGAPSPEVASTSNPEDKDPDTKTSPKDQETSSSQSASNTLPYPVDAIRALKTTSESTGSSSAAADAQINQTGESSELQPYADGPILFAQPWAKLLLNEGSFIRAYATYEFWERRPPSILQNLLGTPHTRPLLSPTIRDFSYIGIFPMEPHFRHLTEECPRVDRLYVQFVPRNEILQSSSRMTQVEQSDLWLERNRCYAILMRELFNAPPIGNFRFLKCFESGDAADRAAWEMAVEYVKRAGNGWKAASEGVFVRDVGDLPEEAELSDDFEGSAL